MEKLAYESELGSKGFLSDIEKGLALPSLKTLKVIADHLGVELLDLATFPGEDARQELVDRTRHVEPEVLRRWLAEAPRSGAPEKLGRG